NGNLLEPIVGLQARTDLEAIHLRHVDVQQNQIRRILPGGRYGQPSARKRPNVEALPPQHVLEQPQIVRLIVHQNDVSDTLLYLRHPLASSRLVRASYSYRSASFCN